MKHSGEAIIQMYIYITDQSLVEMVKIETFLKT